MLVKQKKSLHPEYKQFLKNVKPRTKNYHDKSISITPLSKTTTSLFNKSIIKGKNC